MKRKVENFLIFFTSLLLCFCGVFISKLTSYIISAHSAPEKTALAPALRTQHPENGEKRDHGDVKGNLKPVGEETTPARSDLSAERGGL